MFAEAARKMRLSQMWADEWASDEQKRSQEDDCDKYVAMKEKEMMEQEQQAFLDFDKTFEGGVRA